MPTETFSLRIVLRMQRRIILLCATVFYCNIKPCREYYLFSHILLVFKGFLTVFSAAPRVPRSRKPRSGLLSPHTFVPRSAAGVSRAFVLLRASGTLMNIFACKTALSPHEDKVKDHNRAQQDPVPAEDLEIMSPDIAHQEADDQH